MDCVGKLYAFIAEDGGDEAEDTPTIGTNSDADETVDDGNQPSGSHEDHTYSQPPSADSIEFRDANNEVPLYRIYKRTVEDLGHGDVVLKGRNQLPPPGHEKFVKPPNVFVPRNKTWKFEKETVVATCGEDGQLFYHPDPFAPAPPFRGAPSAAKRMEFAARRIDNRQYRAQRNIVLASDQKDSAVCSKCHMRFFLPFRQFKNRITYIVPDNPYLLPMPRFRCPLCEEDSNIEL
ncbi:hypothetical protein OESDEN_07321 [Oesophagostomum dentatum]|uniref:Uncharacterized protein n=1 Tax=Oesophagostomum dentatum TaxID=61180 RepID=A0A0B1TBR4_OESDE|nr:hypothetical protein OESDEN_07321 [Oesophagostomum dentatum]